MKDNIVIEAQAITIEEKAQKQFIQWRAIKQDIKVAKEAMKEKYEDDAMYLEASEKIKELNRQKKEAKNRIDNLNRKDVEKIEEMQADEKETKAVFVQLMVPIFQQRGQLKLFDDSKTEYAVNPSVEVVNLSFNEDV